MSKQDRTLDTLVLDPVFDKIINKQQEVVRQYRNTVDPTGPNLGERLDALNEIIVHQLYTTHNYTTSEIATLTGIKEAEIQSILISNKQVDVSTGGIADE